jgi:UDP-glucose 4-epimerase
VLPVREDAALSAKNLYGASKVAAEAYCGAFASKGLAVNILRFANVYGPRDTERVIPLWLDRAERGLDLEIYGGRQIIDFVSVETAVEALLRAGEMDLGQPVNVGSGQGTSLPSLAQRILDLTRGTSRIAYLPAREDEVVGFVADVAAMRRFLAVEPPADPLAHLPRLVEERAGLALK